MTTPLPTSVPKTAAQAAADEKQIEAAVKQPSGLNWLAVIGVGLFANIVGVLLHI